MQKIRVNLILMSLQGFLLILVLESSVTQMCFATLNLKTIVITVFTEHI